MSITRLFKRLKKVNKLLLATATAAVLLIVASLVIWQLKQDSGSSKNIVAPTDKCAAANDITFGCYKKELTEIINNSGAEPAFALLKAQYNSVPFVKSQCHQLAHVVGRVAYDKYGNLSDTFANGDQFCWSGYYHGVIEELSKTKGQETVKQANSICEELRKKEAYSFNHYNCVHGLGHGFMFILEQNLFDALEACDTLTDYYERSSCYGGVFMQNIMNVQSPDKETNYASPYLKTDQPMYPCTAIDDKYKGQCYLMQTSYALQTVGYDFKKVFGFCDETPVPYRNTCYQSLGRDASGQSISNIDSTRERCLLGRDYDAQNSCISGAAKDFVAYFHSDQQAKKLCASLPSNLRSPCVNTVDGYFSTF